MRPCLSRGAIAIILGPCIGECPTGALRIVEREALPFDERAVEEHLHQLKKSEATFQPAMACGCPSTQVRDLETEKKPVSQPQYVPFSLLVCADCVPVAYPELHTKLLPEKKVMIGCPKFDFSRPLHRKVRRNF